MRVLIAPQEFKGTLAASEAAEAIAAGIRERFPDWRVDLLPMADGGPGTANAMLAGAGGEKYSFPVHDPLMRPVKAEFAQLNDGSALIECAAASGIWRLKPDEMEPRLATTFGTGELVGHALAMGVKDVIIGLGGSATNDGGAGLAQALGFGLLDAQEKQLPPGGAALANLARIDSSGAHPGIRSTRIVGATDVTNPLCGPDGASSVFGPQKGADASAVAELDRALERFAAVVRRDLGLDVRDRRGAGAAGGLGAGLIAFLNADLLPGAELVGQAIGLAERVSRADVVITGEGRLDGQTASGKAPQHVARLAAAAGRPVVCLAGSLGPGYESLSGHFDVVEVTSAGFGLPEPEDARRQLADAAIRAMLRLADRGAVSGRG
jgi:glycerate kinase